MYSRFLLFLIPAVLLLVAAIVAMLWERGKSSGRAPAVPGNGAPEGSFRAFYHALWILVLWCGLSLALPFWVSYKQKISTLGGLERWLTVGKVLIFPVLVLALLWYGGRQGYLKWVDGLEWPDKENE